jgi:hypothetical protein
MELPQWNCWNVHKQIEATLSELLNNRMYFVYISAILYVFQNNNSYLKSKKYNKKLIYR